LSMSVSGKKVLLDCGARAENIFWQAATAVSIATDAHMEGNILGMTTVTMKTGSSINGIIHSQTFVILQQATITPPVPELGPCLSEQTVSPSNEASLVPSNKPSLLPSDAPSLLPSCVQVEPNIRIVDLGTAGNYAILSKTGISTVPDSVITGNIAVSPIGGAAMTGFSATPALGGTAATSSQVIGGHLYAADYGGDTAAILTQAVLDMHAAYTDAASRTNTDPLRINLNGGILAGDILTPGVYTFTTPIDIQDDITFCGGANDVFIIQTPLTLSMSVSGKKVLLDCGARAENIFWQAATAVSVATDAHMEGNILGMTTVTMMTGSSINGIIHSQTFVTLQQATITPPVPELGPCL